MRANLSNLNHCAVPFLCRAVTNFCQYHATLYSDTCMMNYVIQGINLDCVMYHRGLEGSLQKKRNGLQEKYISLELGIGFFLSRLNSFTPRFSVSPSLSLSLSLFLSLSLCVFLSLSLSRSLSSSLCLSVYLCLSLSVSLALSRSLSLLSLCLPISHVAC